MAKAAVPATIKLVFAIILSLFVITAFASRLANVSNPCWSNILEGMAPFEGKLARDPVLIMNPQCLDRVGITSSMKLCNYFCNSYYSVGDTEDCMKNCESAREDKTMIILIPKKTGFFDKVGGTFNDPKWLISSKPKVYNILGCKLNDVKIDEDRCTYIDDKEGGGWECMPLSDSDMPSYTLKNVRSADDKACSIIAV